MIRLDVQGQLSVQRKIKLLQLPPAKRKRLMGQVVRKVRTASRKRLRTQQGLNGAPWAPRKDGSKKKMLRKVGKSMKTYYQADSGKVAFDGTAIGRIANAHQKGLDEVMTADRMRRIHGDPDYSAPATTAQAKALRAEGYKARKKSGKGYRNTSIREIKETLTQGKAGIILRLMRDSESKRQWVIPLPARDFLGATATEINDMVNTVFDQTIRARA